MLMQTRTQSWESVVDFYAGLVSANPQCEPVRQLCNELAASKYAEALFPTTSMHTLIISQTAEFEWNREVLRIDFDCSRQKFHFEHWEHPWVKQRWTKECGPKESFGAFERFIKLKK